MPEHDPTLPAGATGRCVRERDCVDAVKAAATPGGPPVYVGAPTTGGAFCDTCVRYLRYAIAGLPYDVAELSTLLAPSLAVRYRSPDLPGPPPRVKLHSPMPLDGTALDLQALIDHEVTSWAESVADFAGVDWDSDVAARSSQRRRVHDGAQLLAYRYEWLLGMPPVWHRVRSAGERPTDGWPVESIDRMEPDDHGDLWIERDGVEGALVMFALRRTVEGFAGRTPSDRCKLPCPKCQRPALVREHRNRRIVCRFCWHPMGDNEYERMLDELAGGLGVLR
ncbi:hypothetical protein [Pseudonocardia sp. NPDC049635]|uniref:hypothetical protein n=1 Tax=Pseudonocardia sp. NPDC049635 TaxID=3155506 RepID=UPI0033F67640